MATIAPKVLYLKKDASIRHLGNTLGKISSSGGFWKNTVKFLGEQLIILKYFIFLLKNIKELVKFISVEHFILIFDKKIRFC